MTKSTVNMEDSRQVTSEEVFVFPLSFAQQRLWFLHQLDPSSAAYNMPVAYRLSGRLEVEALQWALNEIVRRHEILRTTFDVLDQQPVQLIAGAGNLPLALTDLSSLPAPENEAAAARLTIEERERPFDLVRGPLIRAVLIRLWSNEHLLLLTMHHIVSDGWSQTLLSSELEVLYEAAVAGRSSPLSDLSIQYADFAEWQRAWLRSEVLDQQMEYWRTHLAGAPASLELPADRPRPPVQSFNGARESFVLSHELSSQLVELSRREDVTLFMTLLAAFKVLLHRYTGETDIVIGTPVANRNRKELETLIGFFVNTLALRTDLSGDPTFRELLARVREAALGAYAHQDLPFEMLVEELQPIRDPSRNPLFQVMFALQNTPEGASQRSDLVIRPVEVKTTRALFDLTLNAAEADGQLHVSFVYNTDLFDAATLHRMAEHFKVLLAGVVAGAGRPVSALPLLTAAELHQLLVEWNDTARELSGEVCVHRLFEQQVESTPEAIALVFEDRRVSYAELNARANKLAHYLIVSGVGPESFVGLMLERSPEMIVALLAILKAGGAYVPLDPAAPPARHSYVLGDAQISLVVSDRRLSTGLPRGVRVVSVDDQEREISQQDDRNPPCWTSGDNAAYVIYTSGSTGAPKGAVIAHRGVCNFVAAKIRTHAIRPESCVLQFASLSFDAAVQEIFTALTAGARLCLVSRETLLSGRRLAELAQEQNVTVATLPPSLLAVMSPQEWPTLETVISAGERCPAEVAARWSQGRRLVNGYGPTETTVGAIFYEYDGTHAGEPPIGRPVSNVQIYLLDQRLNPAPLGARGEIHIGGVGLARGYLHRPDLTAEKFISNPFSTEPGARLYKTGDMARYLADGNIKFLGRRDEQLKIRGFRIEPGEIEATLKEHESVMEAAVLAGEDRRGDLCLVAYVTARSQSTVTVEELRSFVRERLPDYMVPPVFAILDEFPRLPNGKLDRRALRVETTPQVERMRERVGPRDLLESQLAGIWEELLHVEPDVRDNFFDLGGHSLLVVPLLARVEQVTGKKLELGAVYRAPTIESLASLLRREVDLSSPLIAIQPRGPLTPVFFVHPAGGSVFSYFALSRALGPERPFYALEGTSSVGAFTDAQREPAERGSAARRVEWLAANYVEAVRSIHPKGPYLLGGWSMGGVVAFEMARQLQSSGEEVTLVALLDSAAPGHASYVVNDPTALLAGFAATLGVPRDLLCAAPEEVLRSGTQAQLNWVLDQARRAQVLPPDVRIEHLCRWFDLYRADIQAVENYRPQAAPVSLILLRAADEGDGEVENKETAGGWSRLSTNKVEVSTVPGDHLTMMRPPHVFTLAEILRQRFNRAAGQPAEPSRASPAGLSP